MPRSLDVPLEYVRLGLRFDRLESGFVDAYTGDRRVRAAVEDEPAPTPQGLRDQARALLGELGAADLPADRARFIRGQLTALECSARKMAGEPVPFLEEVRSYFQVDLTLGDPAAYAAAHAELDGLLPGSGSLSDRYAAHRRREECPPERLAEAVHVLSSALRDRVRVDYGLPEVETVRYEVVTDKPWSGFNYYEGDYRSRVAINADLPHRLGQLPHLVAHEAYPGHHTEHCRKELGLVERGARLEHTVFLVNTPECLMAEGLADLGVQAAIGTGWGPWAAEVLGDLGLRFDGHLAERVAAVAAPLNRVRQDAAVLLHDRGAGADEVAAYIQRWSLVSADRARQQLRFLTHPLWRAYTTTYVEGFDLLSRWLDARPAEQPVAERFVRLLDEPLTPAAVAGELRAG
ncbi:hypothetical protein [Geodermatophilus obscurus]|uniref:CalR9 protein n=1 Tax=Geodermatophilus obscurus (strain ATCC 25078 / DSM 43160 / JCM 3152 / CCUG 61914 / KCC A-0152 / KCTC 9177 / NBRC 13315 / NRRL B-3577 / G-20) TaxID=526225 RepID=D2S969_GEOOG|nr:hypothetical protein [Geodermatophilus obscurus]ADB73712.1 CalR9 protein [Geodermatophilus obscurus DSM 43160]